MRRSILRLPRQAWLNAIAALMAISGLFTLSGVLFELKHLRNARLVIADAHITVIAGLSLIYLGMLARRGKRNAWYISLAVFGYLFIRNIRHFVFDTSLSDDYILRATMTLIVPAATFGLLILARDLFKARSEVLSLSIALRRALIILSVAFLYGVAGFQLFDQKDFHQEIALPAAAHYTIDQFGLTNNHVTAYTKRSVFFVDSLAAVSITSVIYAAAAFFAPVRFRLSHHNEDYKAASDLVARQSTTSEDFFKLWPRDKAYFFNQSRTAVIAYKVVGGSALAVGDPVGPPGRLKNLIDEFESYCLLNDWSPAFIHAEAINLKAYKLFGYEYQKIGEEALVDVTHFTDKVGANKYFRHINNKFTKLGYSCELLEPPHSAEVLSRLRTISNDWLSVPGRAERGFMMGYFNDEYMQHCRLLCARDGDGTIQGFINELPAYKAEANFDFLRHAQDSPGNLNDYLMLSFIDSLNQRQVKTLNMGLAPLSGLDGDQSSESQLINNFLNFAYINGSRFYSFQGLKRFKSKYEPSWQSRYIVYRGGLAGFGKTMTNLMRAMSTKR
jgi:phosphatidylglycerol lysyltransferase